MSSEKQATILKVAKQAKKKKVLDEEQLKAVIFELDEEEYAVEVKDLKEIIKAGEITPVPKTPDFIKGIINVRGNIIIVVDLEKRFGLVREKPAKTEHIFVVEVNGQAFGVLVDKVKEIIYIAKSAIQPVPKLIATKISPNFLKGAVIIDGEPARLVVLCKIEEMLTEESLTGLGQEISKISEPPEVEPGSVSSEE